VSIPLTQGDDEFHDIISDRTRIRMGPVGEIAFQGMPHLFTA
jgi:hypothetical protein